ncbi:ribonuclease HII [Pseudazoarcus pumilus]|uniref:Ribonuclease HII n=1 Tax=Pseudazoarcus pumilus TaxID=2067960 RepID=A0A2I6S6A3_9RHOO|nr:ribonuclease HII [Pseudazoarcus pumilus]AUN94793.1 ribonuclease HII [Pseudazoarcus pumilus]
MSTLVCGVDEAGRGPLCGSVVAAAVILDPARPIEGLADSKRLTAKRRERLAVQIRERALAWAVAEAGVEEIDRLNILHASLLAMRRAVEALPFAPALVRVDGNRCPALGLPCEAVVGGDALVAEISAASILAKTVRDETMNLLDARYPHYGFARHKGYPTPEHLAALRDHGALACHRRSFGPVRAILAQASLFPGETT